MANDDKDIFDGNEIGREIFNFKYRQTPGETWAERAHVVAQDVVGRVANRYGLGWLRGAAGSIERRMARMQFIPGGRYLYYAGREYKALNNCFGPEVRVLTDRGWLAMGEHVGETVNVLSPVDGKWYPAECRAFGVQRLNKITFAPVRGKSSITWTVRATPNHRWPLKNGTITTELRKGDVVMANGQTLPLDDMAFAHGFAYGDGNKFGQIRLCGPKAKKWLGFFERIADVTYPPSANGEPVVQLGRGPAYKELPPGGSSPEYIASFIKGWLAADGSETASKSIACVDRAALEWFREYAPYAGVVITGNMRSQTRDVSIGKYNYKDHTIYIQNYGYGSEFAGFKVVNIQHCGEEPVYCMVEPVHQRIVIDHGIDTGNCYLLRAEADTREDWAAISWRAESCLSTGGGIGIDYSVYRPKGSRLGRTGGTASGPISKMRMINEIGREVMQGGSRRSAIYGSLNWQHADATEFLRCKNWHDILVPGTDSTIADLKKADFNWPAPLDMTNISLNYDDAWLADRMHPTFIENVRQAMSTGEPGFSFNFGSKQRETLRNAPVSGDTRVLTYEGYRPIREIVGMTVTVWTGEQWARTVFKKTKENADIIKVVFDTGASIKADPTHPFMISDRASLRFSRVPASELNVGDICQVSLPPGLDQDGNESHAMIIAIANEPVREDVYCCDVGVPEHTFCAEGVIISNCTEVTSEDDSDVCNLGSLNMAKFSSIDDFAEAVELATVFLICGTLVAELPYQKVYEIREKNRRLGLGLMGVHEWLIQRGYRYEMNDELRSWLSVYRDVSRRVADEFCDVLGISRPVACRAIAPTGTIGMLAGTTTGIEPLFAVAYKRRYLKNGKDWKYQYVIDGSAKRMIDQYGVDPESIESAIDLARDPERRIRFQANVQDYVDMGISSTINLPAWGTPENNPDRVESFAQTLANYAPRLRGFTCYPDGSRGGQPLQRVDYRDAVNRTGTEFDEQTVVTQHDICEIGGKGGTCGV